MNSTDTPEVLRFLAADDEIHVYGEPRSAS
jgi:hypothetical protein